MKFKIFTLIGLLCYSFQQGSCQYVTTTKRSASLPWKQNFSPNINPKNIPLHHPSINNPEKNIQQPSHTLKKTNDDEDPQETFHNLTHKTNQEDLRKKYEKMKSPYREFFLESLRRDMSPQEAEKFFATQRELIDKKHERKKRFMEERSKLEKEAKEKKNEIKTRFKKLRAEIEAIP